MREEEIEVHVDDVLLDHDVDATGELHFEDQGAGDGDLEHPLLSLHWYIVVSLFFIKTLD
jgi:hypothetical protein